jgi:uncharacterized protein YeaO (DUF488 family)
MTFQVKRVYEPAVEGDGLRVLVDRLWPRGLKRQEAKIDLWQKEIAPSSALRHWFGHDPQRWDEFRRRYHAELDEHASEVEALRERGRQGRVTLLYGARDTLHNQALVLKDYLEDKS